MAKGLFLIGREMFDHPVVGLKKPQWFAAWTWMIGEASWKSRSINIAGKTVILQRGQLSCSLRFMSERLGMTIKGLRVFIKRLEKDTLIVTAKGTGQTIITICNYDIYQDYEKYRAQLRAQLGAKEGHSRGTAGAQTRTPEGTPEETPDIITPKKPKKKTYRISEDWQPDDLDLKHAISKGYSHEQIKRIANKFRDYWIAAQGKNSTTTKVGWNAKWRTWIANDPQYGNGPISHANGGTNQQGSGGMHEAIEKVLRGGVSEGIFGDGVVQGGGEPSPGDLFNSSESAGAIIEADFRNRDDGTPQEDQCPVWTTEDIPHES